jgi:hypothetical protein
MNIIFQKPDGTTGLYKEGGGALVFSGPANA